MRILLAVLTISLVASGSSPAQTPSDREAVRAAVLDYAGEAMPFPDFMSYANGIKSGASRTPAGAPKDIVVFDVQDQTASAKLTAWWGTDYLLLAREKGRWVITHVLWQSPPPK